MGESGISTIANYQRINSLSADEILSEASDLYSRWPKLTQEERRSVVESITEKIVVGEVDPIRWTVDRGD